MTVTLKGNNPLTIPPNSCHLILNAHIFSLTSTSILIGLVVSQTHPSDVCFLAFDHAFLQARSVLCLQEKVSILKAGFCSFHSLTTPDSEYFHVLILGYSHLILNHFQFWHQLVTLNRPLTLCCSNFPYLNNGAVELDGLYDPLRA